MGEDCPFETVGLLSDELSAWENERRQQEEIQDDRDPKEQARLRQNSPRIGRGERATARPRDVGNPGL